MLGGHELTREMDARRAARGRVIEARRDGAVRPELVRKGLDAGRWIRSILR